MPGPASSSKNLFIGGVLRVLRGRPAPVTETFVLRHRRELEEKESKGLLSVFTNKSQRVNLKTLQLTPVANGEEAPPASEENSPANAPGVQEAQAESGAQEMPGEASLKEAVAVLEDEDLPDEGDSKAGMGGEVVQEQPKKKKKKP